VTTAKLQWLAALIALGAGCYGRAVVGERKLDDGTNAGQPPPSSCAADRAVVPQDLPPLTPTIDIAGCREDADSTCPGPGLPRCAALTRAWRLRSLKCIQVDAENTDMNDALEASDIQLDRVRFGFTTQTPASISIERANMSDVAFTLEGALDMQVSDSVNLHNVSFYSRDPSSITLTVGQADSLAINAELGTVILRDLELRGARIKAKSIRIYDTTLTDAELATDDLAVEHSTLQRTIFMATHSHIATTQLLDSEFVDCL
jgi:hypothetical protein